LLVFICIKKISQNDKISFLTTIAFAIHPFANESVLWISERKNLLFVFFYLISIICFLNYLSKEKEKYYFYSLVSYLLSLLSKGSAITLPFVLFVILYIYEKVNFRKILLLLPFVLLTIIFSVLAAYSQKPFLNEKIDTLTSFLLSSWAFWLYFIKAIIPYNMAVFHPIFLDSVKIYYLSGLILFVLLLVYLLKLFKTKQDRVIFFGLIFFLLNIVIYLKIFGLYASSYFMAERYTYLAYIGLYLALFTLLFKFKLGKFSFFTLSLWFLFIGIKSYLYGNTWKNSISLWENVLKFYPESHVALYNYGNACLEKQNYSKAIEAYNKINHYSDLYLKMLQSRAFCFYKLKKYDLAIQDYQEILKHNKNRQDILQNISTILIESGNTILARSTINKLINDYPNFSEAWNSLGNYYFQLSYFDSSKIAYTKAISLSEKAMYFYNRANVYSIINNFDSALIDYDKAIKLDSTQANYYLNRAITFYKMNKYLESLNDFNKALSLQPTNIDIYLNRSTLYVTTGKYDLAILDLNKAIEQQPRNADLYLKRSYLYFMIGKLNLSCEDAKKARELGYSNIASWLEKVCK
jgi:tetratricopeptide (TPR) repeat protein